MNRRKLIKTMFSALLVGGVANTFLMSKISRQDIGALTLAFAKWTEVKGIEPEQFLMQRLASSDAVGKTTLSSLIQDDFSKLHTFELDGYLLSDTEAALIAMGGQWVLRQEQA